MTSSYKEFKFHPRGQVASFFRRTVVYWRVLLAIVIVIGWGLLNEYIHVLFWSVPSSTIVHVFGTWAISAGDLFNAIIIILAILCFGCAFLVGVGL
jgi:hypothetical protein